MQVYCWTAGIVVRRRKSAEAGTLYTVLGAAHRSVHKWPWLAQSRPRYRLIRHGLRMFGTCCHPTFSCIEPAIKFVCLHGPREEHGDAASNGSRSLAQLRSEQPS